MDHEMMLQKKTVSAGGKLVRLLAALAAAFLVSIIAVSAVTAVTAYAEEEGGGSSELVTKITSEFDSIYTQLGTVLTSVAVVAIGICAFKWFSGDQQSARAAKSWMLYICIGIAVFWLAKVIVNTVENMVK